MVRRQIASAAARSDSTVVMLVVESGALYATSVFCLLVTYKAGSNGQYVLLDMITPLVVRSSSIIPRLFVV
jgi:hypothetical protein